MSKNGQKVWVIGGGIAGMTAAHELAERGFAVTVIEPTKDPRFPGRPMLGGVAASQFRRAHVPLEDGSASRFEQPFAPLRAREPLSFNALELGAQLGDDHTTGIPFYAFDWPTFVYVDEGDTPATTVAEASEQALTDLTAELVATVNASKTDETMYVVVTYKSDVEQARAAERAKRQLEALATALDEGVDLGKYEPAPDGSKADAGDYSNVGPSSLVGSLRMPRDATDPTGPYNFIVAAVVQLHGSSAAAQARCNFLQLRLAQQLLPGEHGYRFFPSFYRNLFDTMDRIPLVELRPKDPFRYHTEVALQQGLPEDQRRTVSRTEAWPTRDSVRDNLASVQLHALATQDGTPPAVLPRSSTASVSTVLKIIDAMQRPKMDLPARDMLRTQLRLLQFMTSCPGRRADLSDISFLDFVTDDDTSQAFIDAIKRWPQALAGLRAGDANARTYAAVTVQLALDQARPRSYRDGTLTGPTTKAWFDHWHDYLSGFHDVDFRVGKLTGLDVEDGELKPIVEMKNEPPEADYIVFALDLGAWFRIGGNWIDNAGQTPLRFVADLAKSYDAKAGISREQKYLDDLQKQSVPDPTTAWAQRAIASFEELKAKAAALPTEGTELDNAAQHVERRHGLGYQTPSEPGPIELPFRQYAGIQFFLARDYNYFRGHMYYPNSPWALSSVSQMQFRQSPPDRTTAYGGVLSVILGAWDVPGPLTGKPAWLLPPEEIAREVWEQIKAGLRGVPVLPEDPIYFHIDSNMAFEGEGDAKEVAGNKAPFLVNDARLAGQWPEEPGEYEVHWNKAVFCGTWLDTHTRIVTMESANESARHAVNAILEDVRSNKQSVAVGHDCATFDLELDELADLAPLRALDQELHTRGLPHFMEILKVEKALLPMMGGDETKGGPADLLRALQTYVKTQGELGAVLASHLLEVMRAPKPS